MEKPTQHPGSDASLSIGFILCLVFTITAYYISQTLGIDLTTKIGLIAGFAFIQFLVQMVFFLHLGREKRPRWKLGMFFSMVVVVGILVVGSLWIMHNLNYNMMNFTTTQQNKYLNAHEGL